MYAMMMLVPFFLLPRTRSPRLAFAIGQYVAVRRDALESVGGFEAIRTSITDDMSMAIRMKEAGYRGIFLDAKEAAGCRLYTGYRDAFEGIERSIYSAVGGIPTAALAVTAVVLGVIVGPAVSALWSNLHLQMPAGPVTLSVVLFAVQWALVAWDRNVPLTAVVLYPLVFLNLVIILCASMLRTGFGPGVDWKGRIVRAPGSTKTAPEGGLADDASRTGRV
jgi:hypothetical protein